ncbi:hypothetical protein LBMAG53_08780 [Planctomycetota bacterium]|nr:hypothetical protein LBMAG53_08780 [Planctomycetota bacterium]
MRILIVDDEPLVLDTLVPFLVRCGHDIVAKPSATPAIDALRVHHGDFELIISDVCMPGTDGTEMLKQVRDQYPDIDFILMTAHSRVRDLREAVETGAAGFLRKPIKLQELRHLINRVAILRANRSIIHSLAVSATKERMFARRLHQRVFPTDCSWLHRTEIAIRHLPQAGLGGDYIDVRPYGQGKALVMVADVSGHGTPATFGSIALKTWFSSVETGLSPATVLDRADTMLRELFPGECSTTAFCARYDERTGELTYASAGQPAPIVWSPQHGCRSLATNGNSLADPGRRSTFATVLAEDEVLIAYSDGLTNDLAKLIAENGSCEGLARKSRGSDLRELLTAVLDLATMAAPLKAFGENISLLALRPRPARTVPRPVEVMGKRILHIENDPDLRMVVKLELERLGCVVESMAHSGEALASIDRVKPDLVILDLMMPDGAGQAVLREVRRHHPHLPVLVVTGSALDAAARQCLDLNPAGILAKPLDVQDLEPAVRMALRFDPDLDLVSFDNLGNEWFDFVVSSSTTSVDLVTRYLEALARQPIPAEVLDDLVWCIRETALNGIEWGNRYAIGLRLRISTLILSDRVMVKIADEGSGFDTHRLFEPFDALGVSAQRDRLGKRDGGFGLAMVQAKMDRLEFNQRGNVVLLVKNFPL